MANRDGWAVAVEVGVEQETGDLRTIIDWRLGKQPDIGLEPPLPDGSAKLPSAVVDAASNVNLGTQKEVNAGSTSRTNRAARQGQSSGATGGANNLDRDMDNMPSLETIEEARDRPVQIDKPGTSGPASFRFQNMWLRYPNFMTEVAQNWSYPIASVESEALVRQVERAYDESPIDANLVGMKRATAE
ncbi:hypothetical protein Salat_1653600 [Sesamum alatum]|uniref:Uncharacterized protein n=1 Tax=Sesamum alatum TaxID=300844 RepID=A0AAE1Y6I5_9LAMI|nr:hypothetical protein Salat_1653600 [Sesamum alatum]